MKGDLPTSRGEQYELLVSHKYQTQGWEILSRNFRNIGCEIDIICKKADTVAFVEVKYRSQLPQDLSTLLPPRKRQSLRRGANLFLARNPGLAGLDLRFDLVVLSGHGNVLFYPGIDL